MKTYKIKRYMSYVNIEKELLERYSNREAAFQYKLFLKSVVNRDDFTFFGSPISKEVIHCLIIPNEKWRNFALEIGLIEEEKPEFKPFDIRVEDEETARALYTLFGRHSILSMNKLLRECSCWSGWRLLHTKVPIAYFPVHSFDSICLDVRNSLKEDK